MDKIALENKRLIYKFMGWKIHVDEYPIELYYFPNDNTGKYNVRCETTSIFTLYNDYNSIMAVVEKIESLDIISEFVIGYCNVYKEHTCNIIAAYKIISTSSIISKLEVLYKAVIEFINWYNQNK